MVVIDDGSEFGETIQTIGGGAIEHAIRRHALEAIRTNLPSLRQIALTQELAMCCGGQMTLFIEPYNAPANLFLFGAGHINQWIAYFAKPFDFDITILDPRDDLLSHPHFEGCKTIPGYGDDDILLLDWDLQTFVIVATHSHQKDQEIIEKILPKSFRYLGLVGSKRKAIMTQERLLAKKYQQNQIDRITSPAGLKSPSNQPQHIAMSTVTQMTQLSEMLPLAVKTDSE